MRKIAALVVVAALAATLTACSTGTTSASVKGCTPVKSGDASAAISVSGSFGKTPTVKVKAPIESAKSTERTVITTGSGAVASKGKKVTVDFVIYNGTSGKKLDSTGYNGQPLQFPVDATKLLPGIVKTLECSQVGTRVVGVIPPADAYGSTGSTSLGIGAKDELVFVADVRKVSAAPPAALKSAVGTAQGAKAGFPTAAFSSKGLPTITIPKSTQPSKFEEEVLIKGTGAKVPANSDVIVNYQLVLWRTGKVVAGNDTYASGSPAPFNTGQVVPGFKQALEGQTVGSRVLVVIPPADGYGPTGSAGAGIKGTDDLVFVVDILGLG